MLVFAIVSLVLILAAAVAEAVCALFDAEELRKMGIGSRG